MIPKLLRGELKQTEMDVLELGSDVIDLYKLTRYLGQKDRKINMAFRKSELDEIRRHEKQRGLNLSQFMLERLRAKNG